MKLVHLSCFSAKYANEYERVAGHRLLSKAVTFARRLRDSAMTNKDASGVNLLAAWANKEGHWVRGLIAEVLETRKPLSDVRIDAFYEMFLREKELSDGEPVSVPLLEGIEGGPEGEEPLVLEELMEVQNVNALAEGQSIKFNPGMTVLYGENGVGKTGYVRILKSVASVRTREDIHADIAIGEKAGAPSATLSYRVGDAKPVPLEWKGEVGVPPLNRMDVFDSACVDIHVDGPLKYVYTPSEVAVFKQSHMGVKSVKERLDDAAKKRKPKGNPFLVKFSTDGKLRNKIETLGTTTDLEALERLATLPSDVEEQRAQLEERVEVLRSGTSDARLQVVKSENLLLGRTREALAAFEEFPLPHYEEKLASLRAAEETLRIETERGLAAFPIPGFQGELWSAFVAAADAYTSAELPESYPKSGDYCAYCLQPLEKSALALLKKYREHLAGSHKAAQEKAATELAELVEPVTGLDIVALSTDLMAKVEAADNAHQAFRDSGAVLQKLEKHRLALATMSELTELPLDEVRPLLALVDARISELDAAEVALGEQAGKRKELLEVATAELRDLKDTVVLSEVIEDVKEYVENAKWASRAKMVVRNTASVLRSLTEEMKVAGRRLVYNDFSTTFEKECKALKAPPVNLSFAGESGEPARSKSLAPQVGLRAILSEGEQKVIALADFLAEATLRRTAAPIVFDDPVNSLDYKRMKYVAERLAALSRERQVVVFSHNVWFTMLLLGHFEKDRSSCAYFDVTEAGEKRGRVWRGTSPKLDTWDDRRKRLNKTIERAEKETDHDVQRMFVEKGYEGLRGACEIIAESTMLQSVVQSYRPNVMVGNLRAINVEALVETRDRVCDIFDDCCRFLDSHKQPLETLNLPPTLDGLKKDWLELQDIRKRNKASA